MGSLTVGKLTVTRTVTAETLRQSETEQQPAMELHLGEIHTDSGHHARHAIVWLNGRRWEGELIMQPAGT